MLPRLTYVYIYKHIYIYVYVYICIYIYINIMTHSPALVRAILGHRNMHQSDSLPSVYFDPSPDFWFLNTAHTSRLSQSNES